MMEEMILWLVFWILGLSWFYLVPPKERNDKAKAIPVTGPGGL
jgi:hypothetical protein